MRGVQLVHQSMDAIDAVGVDEIRGVQQHLAAVTGKRAALGGVDDRCDRLGAQAGIDLV